MSQCFLISVNLNLNSEIMMTWVTVSVKGDLAVSVTVNHKKTFV